MVIKNVIFSITLYVILQLNLWNSLTKTQWQ